MVLVRPFFLCFAVLLSTACAPLPALDRTLTPALEAADYPDLVPLDPIVARASTPGVNRLAATRNLDARVAALRSRAARLRGSVLSGQERLRLKRGLR